MTVGMVRLRAVAAATFLAAASVCAAPVMVPALVSEAWAQSASSIVVEGNRRVEADTVRAYFQPGPSGRIDAVSIDNAYKALYSSGLFSDVRIRQAGGRIIVTVDENAVINRVAFEGNHKIKDDQLLTEVQSKPRGPLSRAMVQSDAQRISEIYRRGGRFDVRVEPKMIDQPNGRVDLVFEINEGGKTGVRTIQFVGNNAVSSYRLRDIIRTRETNMLSFLGNADIYDPDRVEADRDLIRRYYLKNGYADVQVVAATTEYDPGRKGFVVTFTIDEGPQYRVGSLDMQSSISTLDANSMRSLSRVSVGSVYNAEAVEKSVEDMTIEAAKRGYAFATVRPRGERNFENRTVALAFVIEEGQRVYIERINIRGNTRTRDYVVRREFDISEGDAYNRALVDRAERRIRNLDYFKTVKITPEPGSSPDRIVLNVDLEEKSTGDFSVTGGYSTVDGFMGEVGVTERNLLGRGLYAKASVAWGQRSRGYSLSFVEPYLFGYRLALGLDLYQRTQLPSNYMSYGSETAGAGVRLGFALREDLSFQARYSLSRQKITLSEVLNDCKKPTGDFAGHTRPPLPGDPCYTNGEAALPVRIELDRGATVTSAVGYTLAYNTLDNNRNPTLGMLAEFKQDFAGVGGDVKFIRSTVDARYYYPVFGDVVGMVRGQGGHITGWNGAGVRMLDNFQLGPQLVRGFAPSGIGPRDISGGSLNQDALGGTMYWGASAELQMPFWFLPKEMGIKGTVFADAGSLWGYRGPNYWSVTGENISDSIAATDKNVIRSSIGAGIIWDSPFGPLRFDYAVPLSKASYDKTQYFRFSGGTSF